jgi:hypothetical protein
VSTGRELLAELRRLEEELPEVLDLPVTLAIQTADTEEVYGNWNGKVASTEFTKGPEMILEGWDAKAEDEA